MARRIKKVWMYALGVLVVIAAWYLISPAFISTEVDEASPLDGIEDLDADVVLDTEIDPVEEPEPEGFVPPDIDVDDKFATMTDEEKMEFMNLTLSIAGDEKAMDEAMDSEPSIHRTAEFMPRAHEVEGEALFIDTPDGRVLRFENFETINGPNLHVYLASDLSDNDFLDLGELRATKGNFNYELPDVDTTVYNKVLVWCVPFGVLFSYADLS